DVSQKHPGSAVAAAAEYWRLRIQLARCVPGPASQPSAALRVELVERFLEHHAGASEGPALIAEVIKQAYEAEDFVSVDRLLARLEADYPSDPTTRALVGQNRLRRSVGTVWAPVLDDGNGSAVDWMKWRGRPVLVAFWASWDPASRGLLRALSGWKSMRDRERPSLVAISLDLRKADAESAL